MFIRLGYEIDFELPAPTAMVSMLSVHPSRAPDLRAPDELHIEPEVEIRNYIDGFGNRCGRFVAPAGTLRLRGATLIEDPGTPDPVASHAREHPVGELPDETLIYLLNSRYCEVDRLSNIASDLFGAITPGWGRVQAICNWVNSRVMFGYHHARSTRTALDVFTDRVGVCRDYQHLAIGFCRALNIPARYCTGYLGDIGVPLIPPMDFSARFRSVSSFPRLSASGHWLLPRLEYSSALLHWIPGRHRRSPNPPDGFQRVVRGLSGGSMVGVRRAQ